MRAADTSACSEMRPASARSSPSRDFACRREHGLKLDAEVALADQHNNCRHHAVGNSRVGQRRDARAATARPTCATRSSRDALVGELYAAGPLRVLQLPRYYDFKPLRLTPAEVRARLAAMGRTNVVAFQTRNPLHRAHEELTARAAREIDGALLLHPVVGMTKPGDIDHFTRVRSYKALAERYYDPARMMLALLPLAMRMAGPREALWHAPHPAQLRRQPPHRRARPRESGVDSQGRPFTALTTRRSWSPVTPKSSASGRSLLRTRLPARRRPYEESRRASPRARARPPSPLRTCAKTICAEVGNCPVVHASRSRLDTRRGAPAATPSGFCVWFTGLSGAGKSTTAEILAVKLLEHGRQVTVLTGRGAQPPLEGLGFSKEDRDINHPPHRLRCFRDRASRGRRRLAAVSPYHRATRTMPRVVATPFVEVFVDAPLEVCEGRDVKGMYALAREVRSKTSQASTTPTTAAPPVWSSTPSHAPPRRTPNRISRTLAEQGFVLPLRRAPRGGRRKVFMATK